MFCVVCFPQTKIQFPVVATIFVNLYMQADIKEMMPCHRGPKPMLHLCMWSGARVRRQHARASTVYFILQPNFM